uniref:Uncharacterized protein n=1 Tax=Kalanchoe fedtschenkoi TaxID=63787 RepID=A0A7N0V179_KALFE
MLALRRRVEEIEAGLASVGAQDNNVEAESESGTGDSEYHGTTSPQVLRQKLIAKLCISKARVGKSSSASPHAIITKRTLPESTGISRSNPEHLSAV